jgi:hypothetical protein
VQQQQPACTLTATYVVHFFQANFELCKNERQANETTDNKNRPAAVGL